MHLIEGSLIFDVMIQQRFSDQGIYILDGG
jgi:predicted ATPase